jgi:hypothetical protein
MDLEQSMTKETFVRFPKKSEELQRKCRSKITGIQGLVLVSVSGFGIGISLTFLIWYWYLLYVGFAGIRIPSVYNENGIRILFSLYTLGIRLPSVYRRTLVI